MTPTKTNCPSSGTGKRIAWVLIIGAVVAVFVSVASSRSHRAVAPPPEPLPMARMNARKLQTHAADNAIIAGAQAAQKESAVSIGHPSDPTADRAMTIEVSTAGVHAAGKSKAIRITRIRSESPQATHDKALADALAVAQTEIVKQLRSLDPPCETVPSIAAIRGGYLRTDTVTEITPTPEIKADWEKAKIDPNRLWVEIDVEISDDQIRDLRSEGRVTMAGGIGAGMLIVLIAIFGFLRLDAWTKGYLTMGLATITALAVAGLVGALIYALRSGISL